MAVMTQAVQSSVTEAPRPPEDSLRAGVYGLLASLFSTPPDAGMLQRLRGVDIDPRDRDSALGSAWALLSQAAQRADAGQLQEEYQELFIGVGRGELVPYGSWYMTGFLMERPLAALRQDLAGLGIERQEGVCEPEDHVAGLCDSMRLIIEHGGTDQRVFFNRHIAPWIGRFAHDLQQAPSASFYRAVGHLAERFFEFESQYLAMPE